MCLYTAVQWNKINGDTQTSTVLGALSDCTVQDALYNFTVHIVLYTCTMQVALYTSKVYRCYVNLYSTEIVTNVVQVYNGKYSVSTLTCMFKNNSSWLAAFHDLDFRDLLHPLDFQDLPNCVWHVGISWAEISWFLHLWEIWQSVVSQGGVEPITALCSVYSAVDCVLCTVFCVVCTICNQC